MVQRTFKDSKYNTMMPHLTDWVLEKEIQTSLWDQELIIKH